MTAATRISEHETRLGHWSERLRGPALPCGTRGSWLERRAAAAALCEPALLTEPRRVEATLAVLEAATAGVATAGPAERRSEEFKAFRKGLGYCWSVAVAAAPETGAPAFEALVERAAASGDRDLRWIVRENLRKRRLTRLDPDWVAALLARLG